MLAALSAVDTSPFLTTSSRALDKEVLPTCSSKAAIYQLDEIHGREETEAAERRVLSLPSSRSSTSSSSKESEARDDDRTMDDG